MKKSYDRWALETLRVLVGHVFSHSGENIGGITYQEVARRIGRINKHGEGHGHGMGKILGALGNLLEGLEGEFEGSVPHIQSLVVNKSGPLVGLPDDGIQEFWPDYPRLTRAEKMNKVQAEYRRIIDYGVRWTRVLESIHIKHDGGEGPAPDRKIGGYGGGESAAHRELKEYALNNPDLFGLKTEFTGFTEYVFPSLDAVGVLFKTPTTWIAVEVKSRISDLNETDYERGLYQCIKYRALLEAMKKEPRYSVPRQTKVVLLLETSLPAQYKPTAQTLDVSFIELGGRALL